MAADHFDRVLSPSNLGSFISNRSFHNISVSSSRNLTIQIPSDSRKRPPQSLFQRFCSIFGKHEPAGYGAYFERLFKESISPQSLEFYHPPTEQDFLAYHCCVLYNTFVRALLCITLANMACCLSLGLQQIYRVSEETLRLLYTRLLLHLLLEVVIGIIWLFVKFNSKARECVQSAAAVSVFVTGVLAILSENGRLKTLFRRSVYIGEGQNGTQDEVTLLCLAGLLVCCPIFLRLQFRPTYILSLLLYSVYVCMAFAVPADRSYYQITVACIVLIIIGLVVLHISWTSEIFFRARFLDLLRQREPKMIATSLSSPASSEKSRSSENAGQGDDYLPTSMEGIIQKLKRLLYRMKGSNTRRGSMLLLQDMAASALDVENIISELSRSSNLWTPELNKTLNMLSNQYDDDTKRFLLQTIPAEEKIHKLRQVYSAYVSRSQELSDSGSDSGFLAAVAGVNDSAQFKNIVSQIGSWNLDSFELDEVSESHPVLTVGMHIFRMYDLLNRFTIPVQVAQQFFTAVNTNYKAHNPYHNAIHAADVANSLLYLLEEGKISTKCSSLDLLSVVVAALVHDLGHPGLNNAFLIATESEQALMYNDISVLENFHVASTFQLLKDPHQNILATLSVADRRHVRSTMIALVLETDMAKHFDALGHFRARAIASDFDAATNAGDRLLVLKFAMKCADIGHGAKELRLHKLWSGYIIEEFFRQGDLETDLGLPVSPYCDRNNANLPKSQEGFLDFLVIPLYQAFTKLLHLNTIADMTLRHLQENKEYWRSVGGDREPAKSPSSFSGRIALSLPSSMPASRAGSRPASASPSSTSGGDSKERISIENHLAATLHPPSHGVDSGSV
eukprot:GILK01004774.1.p1 GENE.GILK01004774.1~~GILK01004774.1.p1  ORF type:complete len:861 (+),score=104.97 GILK01004774.1:42-2585(+)